MSEFEKLLALTHEGLRREKIRCICFFACFVIVLASALGVFLYCMPPPISGVCVRVAPTEPVTYTFTDTAGTTTTTTHNGNQTITTVTNAEGKIISTSIISRRRITPVESQQRAAERKAEKEQRAAERAERRAQREARRLKRQAARLERQAERLRRRANK